MVRFNAPGPLGVGCITFLAEDPFTGPGQLTIGHSFQAVGWLGGDCLHLKLERVAQRRLDGQARASAARRR